MSEWHKSDVVSGGGLGERLVVHLHRLNLSGQLVGAKVTTMESTRSAIKHEKQISRLGKGDSHTQSFETLVLRIPLFVRSNIA